MTGKAFSVMKDPIVVSTDEKTGLVMRLMKSDTGSVIWSVVALGAGRCVDDTDKVNLLFADGTRLELENDSKYNCDATQTLYFGSVFGKLSALQALSQKEIATVRVWTSDGYVERDLTPVDASTLKFTFSCLSP